MTMKELSKYCSLKKEIIQLEDSIKELESTILSSSQITDNPIGKIKNICSPTERISLKLTRLKEKLIEKKEKLVDENNKIEDFLKEVDDPEIRLIIRKKFVEDKSWEKIGQELNSDRTTSYYKVKNYLKGKDKNSEEKL